jgi:hypothetical protein
MKQEVLKCDGGGMFCNPDMVFVVGLDRIDAIGNMYFKLRRYCERGAGGSEKEVALCF